ncbi:MAG: hypothetical protein KKA07_09880 [Bacteroidetes bacterium]|nr:hypothetical protein [Bacteroidota bacterium]MBU1719370.1 hypothetical protein [Bacteroidota bacterium]
MRRTITGILLILCSVFRTSGQDSEEFIKEYLNLKLGYGSTFLGTGCSLEFGSNHVSGFATIGYMGELETGYYGLKIPAGLNFTAGLRYYFFQYEKETIFRPAVGIRYGWIDKYYDPGIGLTPYNHNLTGVSAAGLVQIYIRHKYNLELGIGLTPEFALIKTGYQPYTKSLYFFPFIGVGWNLLSIKQKRIDTQANRYQMSLEWQIRDRKIRRSGFLPYQDACSNTVLYQEIDTAEYLVIRFDLERLKLTPDFQTFRIDSIKGLIDVFIAPIRNLTWDLCCTISDMDSVTFNEAWKAESGYVTLAVSRINRKKQNPYRVSALLSGLVFKRKDSTGREITMFLDDFNLIDILNKRFCMKGGPKN